MIRVAPPPGLMIDGPTAYPYTFFAAQRFPYESNFCLPTRTWVVGHPNGNLQILSTSGAPLFSTRSIGVCGELCTLAIHLSQDIMFSAQYCQKMPPSNDYDVITAHRHLMKVWIDRSARFRSCFSGAIAFGVMPSSSYTALLPSLFSNLAASK